MQFFGRDGILNTLWAGWSGDRLPAEAKMYCHIGNDQSECGVRRMGAWRASDCQQSNCRGSVQYQMLVLCTAVLLGYDSRTGRHFGGLWEERRIVEC